MHCVMTGATGLVGVSLVNRLVARGDTVTVLSRDPSRVNLPARRVVRWDAASPLPEGALDGADAVVHLAGESVADGRWTAARRRRMVDSRVQSGSALVDAIGRAGTKPRVLVSASAVGIYGDRGAEVLDEESTPGRGFLADVCMAWERSVEAVEPHGVRRVSVRLGVVLARGGGALAKMLPVFRAGLGGKLGSGQQWFPWIHLDDAVGILLHALDDGRARGALNAVSPGPVTNEEFTRALGHALHRPALFTVPRAALALAMGEMGSVLLDSQRVMPKRALEQGFAFRHPGLDEALRSLV